MDYGLGFVSRLELVLGLGATRQMAPEAIRLWLLFGLELVLGVGGEGGGAIFLGHSFPRTFSKTQKFNQFDLCSMSY